MTSFKIIPTYARPLFLLLVLAVFAISTSAANAVLESAENRSHSARTRLDDISRVYGQLLSRDLTGTGGACVRNSDCRTASCYRGVCFPNRAQPDQDCNPAGDGSDCNSGKCNSANGLCLASDIGGDCRDDEQCASGYCNNYVCTLRSTGTACDAGGICATGQCDIASNMCILKPLGATCGSSADCDSGACNGDGVCALQALGAPCAYNTRCESGWCLTQPLDVYPYSQRQCSPAPSSTSCTQNSDCGSGNCGDIGALGFGQCKSSPPGAQCTSLLDCASSTLCNNNMCTAPPGASCSGNSDCSSGVCNQNGVCASLTNGQPCGTDAQCKSAKCSPPQERYCGVTGRGPCKLYSVCQINNALGAPCSTTSDCGAQYTVCTIPDGATEGTCIYPPPSIEIGQTCQQNMQCLSGRCDRLDFTASLLCQGQPGGQPCTEDKYCATGSCIKAAGVTTGVCKINKEGEYCPSNGDCQSFGCGAGNVCKKAAGSTCSDNSQCGSGVCCQGVCQALRRYSYCQDNDQCRSGVCDAGAAQWRTVQNQYAIGACSSSSLPDGSVCSYASECTSGQCSTVGFYTSSGSKIGQCGPPATTAAPFTCSNQPTAVGAPCTQSGSCISSYCSTGSDYSYGGRRDFNNTKRADGVCLPSKIGRGCFTSADCSEGLCDATKKCSLGATGSTCSTSLQCKSNFCNPNTATCTLNSALGGACTTTDDCTEGGCFSSVCSKLPVDQPCSSSSQCSSAWCQWRSPTPGAEAQQLCTPAPSRYTCSSSADCGSGSCVITSGATQGTCKVSAAGETCTSVLDCDGYAACSSAGLCLARGAAACSSNSMCASGVCNAGFCSGVAPSNGCYIDSDCASLQCGPTYTTICGSNGFGPCNTFQSCNPVSAIGGICSADGDCTAASGVCSKAAGSSTGTCQVATSTTTTSTSATTSTTTSTTSTSTTASTTTTSTASTPSATPPYANG
ncbi:hypothetical protein CF326_g7083, partial [Tilletia indica]